MNKMFADRERQSIGFRFRGGPFRHSPRGDMYSAFSTSPSEPPYAERPPAPNHMSITRKTMSLTQKNSQFIVGEEHVSLRSHWTLDLSINGLQQVENERRPFLGVQVEPFSRLIPTFVFRSLADPDFRFPKTGHRTRDRSATRDG